jgi:uncharacterized membrane protein
VLALALIGLVAASAAAYTHYRLIADPSYVSFCDISLVASCSQVYASRFGSVGGISVAVFGMIWFAFATLLGVAGVAGPVPVRARVPGYLFAGSTVALAVVLYLGYASLVVLQLVCVLCLVTYGAVVGLFLTTGAASPSIRSVAGHAAADLKLVLSRPVSVVSLAALMAGALALLVLFPRDHTRTAAAAVPEDEERVQFEQWYAAQPRVALDIPADGAHVLIVKFNDYQCPPCRQTNMEYEPILAKFEAARPGAVRLVLRDFPLESECNSGVAGDLHAAACEAAVAVRLARERGTAARLEEWLFANQAGLTPGRVEEAAREVGQVTDFAERYPAVLEEVKADIALGRALGVRATPTFFVNGAMIQGGLPPHLFEQAVMLELERP